MSSRDDFNAATKRLLAQRAAYLCSNPDCQRRQIAPAINEPNKVVQTGKAAHICAASKGGPRYNAAQSPEERVSSKNGIFLCGVCADLIDKNGGVDHPVELLNQWKEQHENKIRDGFNRGVLDRLDETLTLWVGIDDTLVESWQGEIRTVRFGLVRRDSIIAITPSLPYLEMQVRGDEISSASHHAAPFKWDFPNLEMKLVNNGQKMVYIAEATFDVASSKLDPSPVLFIERDRYRTNALKISVWNEGWGPATNVELKFNTSAPETPHGQLVGYSHSLNVGAIDGHALIDVAHALASIGVDLARVEKEIASSPFNKRMFGQPMVFEGGELAGKTAEEIQHLDQEFKKNAMAVLGKFHGGYALVSGVLEFDAPTIDGINERRMIRFVTEVFLFNTLAVAAPAAPSFQYNMELEVEGKDYSKTLNINQTLAPGEADWFNMKIRTRKSSAHVFTITLLLSDGSKLFSPTIHLATFVPKSSVGLEGRMLGPNTVSID